MYRALRISVVVPAYNEERALGAALRELPDWIDHIVVVDDASHDGTSAVARAHGDGRLALIRHLENRGVGAAIVTGYRAALAAGSDVAVVMAGDGQMDPADLPALLEPLAAGTADYVKGNRFRHRDVWTEMPPARIVGNILLSAATKITSGYRHVFDSQCGYTAIHRRALAALDLDAVFPRYGYPNDLLAHLHVARMRVAQVAVRPIYGEAWHSGIRWSTALGTLPMVLARSFGQRLARERRAATPR